MQKLKFWKKKLDYAPIQNKINEPELKRDFENFLRQMRLKWFLGNEPTPSFSETPTFKAKSSWNPPKGYPCLEVYLSQVEKDLFELGVSHLGYSNFTKEEWTAIRSLADDRSIIIKKAGKGSCVVVKDRNDYIAEAEKQLGDKNIYQDVNFSNRILRDLVDKSNKMFRSLKPQCKITEKKLKYFTYEYQKATNLGKMYLLLKYIKGYLMFLVDHLSRTVGHLQRKFQNF